MFGNQLSNNFNIPTWYLLLRSGGDGGRLLRRKYRQECTTDASVDKLTDEGLNISTEDSTFIITKLRPVDSTGRLELNG